MARFYKHDVIDHTPIANISSGTFIAVGALVLFAPYAVAAGQKGAFQPRGWIQDAPKASGAFTSGQVVYFDPTENTFYAASATGRIPAGYAIGSALSADTVFSLYLCPSVQLAAAS